MDYVIQKCYTHAARKQLLHPYSNKFCCDTALVQFKIVSQVSHRESYQTLVSQANIYVTSMHVTLVNLLVQLVLLFLVLKKVQKHPPSKLLYMRHIIINSIVRAAYMQRNPELDHFWLAIVSGYALLHYGLVNG